MEEYIRLEEEKARKRGKVFNWEIAKYGKIWYNEDVHDLRSVKTEFLAIVFKYNLTSNETLSCEPTVSSLNNNKIDFRISFDESDDEDYTVVFKKNLFSYKIISTNDLKTDSENDDEKINMPLFPSLEPSVSCIDDLDFFKDFENEFAAIVYNDALTYKSDFSTEPTLCPQHINKFDFKDETSLSEYDEEEQNVLYFNDIFPFNILYPDDLKLDKDDDDNEIDMIQSSRGNENTQGSNKLLEASHDKINKVFIMKSFVMELNVNIVAWNYFVNRMLFNLIKNLYMPFGLPFDPKRYYKDGDCTRMLRRPRAIRYMAPLPPHDQRHLWLHYQVEGYTKEIDLAERLKMVYTGDDGPEVFVSHAWRRIGSEMGLDVVDTLCFQLGGARRSMTWRQFILALGLHTAEEIAKDGFGTYWLGSERVIPNKGDLSDYWVEISSGMDFLRAQYMFTNAEGRKSNARLSGGHFIGRLAHYFGLVRDDGLRGLSVITHEIPLIDMGELVKLNTTRRDTPYWELVKRDLAAKKWTKLVKYQSSGILCVIEVVLFYNGLDVPVLFYNGLDVPTRQILDSRGAIPSKTAADVKVPTTPNIAHSKKKGKPSREVYYTQFGAPFQGGGYRATALGFYQRNNAKLVQEKKAIMRNLRKIMGESAKKTEEENSNLIRTGIRASRMGHKKTKEHQLSC
ncbi:hypothetical protein Tco_0019133 [Tanacetum coccineum]